MQATSIRRNFKRLGLSAGVAGILAAAMVAGSSVSAPADARPSPDRTAADAQDALAKGKVDKAISLAEAVVAASPREASYRVLLGNAYLRAGRFESASQAFDDAMTLGDNSSHTALALALAKIGAGHNQDAAAILDDWRDAIPAADMGLALALAGQTGRGVAILTDTLRGGENTPKVRQNLAYAYALDGRWREARLMAMQDVPANQIDDRIGEWASRARPEDTRSRVAALLKVPVRSDSGQPAALALVSSPGSQQLAAETAAQAGPQPAAAAELPAKAQGGDLASYRPVDAPAAPAPATVAPAPSPFETAFVTHEVVQPAPAAPVARPEAQSRVAAAPRPKGIRPRQARDIAYSAKGGGTHLVQLGAFSSEQGARRAWGIYARQNPELKRFRMNISEADVRGKHVWRVAAAGLNAGGASGLCATVKGRGGACFAYAASRGIPQPLGEKPAAQMAKAAVPAKHEVAVRSPIGPATRHHR